MKEGFHKKKNTRLVSKGIFTFHFILCFHGSWDIVREMTKAKFLGTTSFSDAFGIAVRWFPTCSRRLFAEIQFQLHSSKHSKATLNTPTLRKERRRRAAVCKRPHSSLVGPFFDSSFCCHWESYSTPLIMRIFYKTEDVSAMSGSGRAPPASLFPYLFSHFNRSLLPGQLKRNQDICSVRIHPHCFLTASTVLLKYILSPIYRQPGARNGNRVSSPAARCRHSSSCPSCSKTTGA